MEGPIYKLFRVRWTDAWYQLSPEERNDLLAKEAELRKEVGVKNLVMCDSGWHSERWNAYGVHEYPDMDAVVKHYEGMVGMNLFRYMDSDTTLGKAWGD